MTHKVWNMSGKNQAAVGVRPAFAVLFLALVLLVPSGRVRAAGEPSRPNLVSSSSTQTTKDVELEARVLRALRQDAELVPLNLGVHISGGTAKLSGPVPTTELKQRAVKIVERIDGVLRVSAGDLYISSSAKGRKRVPVLIQYDQPTQTRAASPPSPSSTSETLAQSDSRLPIFHPQKSSIQVVPAGAGQQITLLAPEMADPTAHVPEAACLTGNPRPASPSVSIVAAIEQLRQRDMRYQRIRARVQGTTVYVIPGETAVEDAMMFAQAVRRLAGVQHVILDSSSR